MNTNFCQGKVSSNELSERKHNNTLLAFPENVAVTVILEDLCNQLEIVQKNIISRSEQLSERDSTKDTDEGLREDKSNSEVILEYFEELEKLRSEYGQKGSEFVSKSKTKQEIDEPRKIDAKKSHQFAKDVSSLIEILSSTKSEIQRNNSFTQLKSYLASEKESLNKESILTVSLHSKQERVKSLQKEIAQFEKQTSQENHKQISHLNNLKDQLHLTKQKGDSELQFINVWLTARNEHEKEVTQKNEILDKRLHIKSTEAQINRDILAYENVTSWTKLISSQLQNKIENWKKKFAHDISNIERRIEQKKLFIEAQHEQIKSLEKQIDERMAELAPWEEEKRQEVLERVEHMRKFISSKKIQRWWRKHMIQHGLYCKKKVKPKTKTKRRGGKSSKK